MSATPVADFPRITLNPKGMGGKAYIRGHSYAIVIDFDIAMLAQLYPDADWRAADDDVRLTLEHAGFKRLQGHIYLGDETTDAVRCITIVQEFAAGHPWFAPSLRDIRMLRITDNDDLMPALQLATRFKAR
jgi:virulence-associated protein VapD